jgi:uncharacterized protein YgfB (UPF0149 family)
MIDITHHDARNSDTASNYDTLDRVLRDSSFDGSAAQAYGIACGLVCRDIKSADFGTAIEHLNFSDAAAMEALESLIEMAERDLNQVDFAFDLWLPETDELHIQLDAMAEWSQGFIIGLMFDGSEFRTRLSAEINESVQDIIEISGLESTASGASEDEMSFIELSEYLRMATQLIYEELNPDRPINSTHE